MDIEKPEVKVGIDEQLYVWDALSGEGINRTNFDDFVCFDVLDCNDKPETLIGVFTQMFKQVNNSSNKISIYFYTDLLNKINNKIE